MLLLERLKGVYVEGRGWGGAGGGWRKGNWHMYIQHKHKADTTFFIFTSKRFVYLHIFDIHMKELVNNPNGNVLFFLVHVS